MIISAIISTFNAKKFFENCLIDLIEQSVCKKSELEIVIIDSGSEQNESEIINIYRKKYDFIKCLRTEKRETLYPSVEPRNRTSVWKIYHKRKYG